AGRKMGCRWDCNWWAGAAPTVWCCVWPRRSRHWRRGPTGGRRNNHVIFTEMSTPSRNARDDRPHEQAAALPEPSAGVGNGGRGRGGRNADAGQATVEGWQYLNTQVIRFREWWLPASLSWSDNRFLRLDDDAVSGQENQQQVAAPD